MEYRIMVMLLWLLLGIATATEIHLSNKWLKDYGWEVTCEWELPSNESLQSVRLYHNDRQFMIYRPERDDHRRYQRFQLTEHVIDVNCADTQERGVRGNCYLTVGLIRPQEDVMSFTCEVSLERPTFLITRKDIIINAFVPPSAAVIGATSKTVDTNSSNNETSKRVVLNCTSRGMPAPSLVWTIGEQQVPHDFTDRYWNMTSKLWHVWSQLSYTPSDEHPSAICTPEVNRVVKEGESVKQLLKRGQPAEFMYNSASSIDVRKMYLLLMSLLLLR